MSLNMIRVNLFVKSKMSESDTLKFRSMMLYLIKNKLLREDIKDDLNKVIELEDIMDDPGSEAMRIITNAFNESKETK